MSNKIKVLIAEDSKVVTEYLKHILESDDEIEVIITAVDGIEVIEFTEKYKPDIITMDVHMPKMNGFDATRKIMELYPTPIIIVSASYDPKEMENSFRAMQAGAVSIIKKPRNLKHPEYRDDTARLVRMVKLMSQVKVVRRRTPQEVTGVVAPKIEVPIKREIGVVAIGASTGGPPVLNTILSKIPQNYPVPVLIVQHIAPGFLPGMINWLQKQVQNNIKQASHGEKIFPGNIYVAPDNYHMGLDIQGKIALSGTKPENGVRPSVSFLFRSIANEYNRKAAGVLLTGMGSDGAEELKLLKEKGAVTIIQNEETCVVFGMPGRAKELSAGHNELSPDEIAFYLKNIVKESMQ